MAVLETARLTLRELGPGDLPGLAEMLQDPQVMAAYEHDFTDGEVRAWLDRQRARYARDGHGLWAVCRREDGEMVGQAGLTWQPWRGAQVLEIGYLLQRRHWHRGYAREAAAGCRDYAFAQLGAPAVHAVIKADNRASQRVAAAIGLRREDASLTRYFSGERLHYLYVLRRPE